MNKKFDFGGYATKVGIKCSDGRTISKDAFAANDGQSVPLVWQHMHNDPNNILGHAVLENRNDGVYAYCFFNETSPAGQAKALVKHGDISSLSIYANSLVEKSKLVIHGMIREVSLVLAGANEGAKIDNIAFEHGDGEIVQDETEALIYSGLDLEFEETLKHAENQNGSKTPPKTAEHADQTIGDVFDAMTDVQKTVVYAMIAEALDNGEAKHSDEGEKDMKKNVFDKTMDEDKKPTLTHDDFKIIFAEAQKCGSLKQAFLAHAGTLAHLDPRGPEPLTPGVDYGIENLDYLFPEARNVTNTPTFIKRDMGWVSDAFRAAHHVPFSKIKTMHADITADEARARGYVTGKKKMEEVITLLKRQTGPTTVYKKQRLDRDDMIDITDFDVVAWLRAEMRLMLEEELARAVLIGDGRSTASDDKIREDCIRPIYSDDDLYSVKVRLDENATTMQVIDQFILARKLYKGSGNPVLFATQDIVGDMLLLKDTTGRRLYNNMADLTSALRVSKIIEVPVMENVSRVDTASGETRNLLGIVVNMNDYYVGADKGGAVSLFDDFDIDYNQYKYLIETRCSGALTVPFSALVFEQVTTTTPAP